MRASYSAGKRTWARPGSQLAMTSRKLAAQQIHAPVAILPSSPGSPPCRCCQRQNANSTGTDTMLTKRIDRIEPRDGNGKPKQVEVRVIVDPDERDIRILVIGDRLKDRDEHDEQESPDDARLAASAAAAPRPCSRLRESPIASTRNPLRYVASPINIRTPAKPKPACQPYKLREQAAGERTDHRADVDRRREDGEAAVRPAPSSSAYSAPTWAEMLPLSKPQPTTSSTSASEKRLIERHRDVAGAHSTAPSTTALRWPIQRSAMIPPNTGVK